MKRKNIFFICLFAAVVAASFLLLSYYGIIWPNYLFASGYPVRGIDISNHQKVIDWEKAGSNEKVEFVFIKATEGKDYRDKYFKSNWDSASNTKIIKGAYHYFTTTSSGMDQAYNFISQVPVEKGCLPPVVDVEVRGTDKTVFIKNLHDLVGMLEETYLQTPIIYTVYPIYDEYIKGEFDECPVWIRDIIKPPRLSDGKKWLFWQFYNRGRIDGIDTYVDLNVFNGNIEKLESLLSK